MVLCSFSVQQQLYEFSLVLGFPRKKINQLYISFIGCREAAYLNRGCTFSFAPLPKWSQKKELKLKYHNSARLIFKALGWNLWEEPTAIS